MDVSSAQLLSPQHLTLNYQSSATITAQYATINAGGDTVQFGSITITSQESFSIVLERAQNQLQSVVSDARAQLGLPEDAQLDLSADATANRIADFALGFFEQFLQNHQELSGGEAKQAFVDLILPAIEQGISEAREILSSLSALSGETNTGIDSIYDQILNRIDQFLGNSE